MTSNVDNPFQSPFVLSTCTGMRGLEIGVERVLGRVNPVAYVEIEAFVCENLVQQMEQGVLAPTPIWTNLKTFPWESFYGKLHWIFGGYPCQPFSQAGLRKGADDPRHLWPSYRSGIKKSRPMGVFFENVEGHLSLGLRDVLTDLRKLGYQVEAGLFSAAEVGAPHRRNRVFILGLENSFILRMRGWSDEQRAYWKRQIQTKGSGFMADSGCVRQAERQIDANRTEQCCSVENTHNERCGETGGCKIRANQPSELGNANNKRLEGWECGGGSECSCEWTSRSNGPFDLWPASPGEPQFEWEAPRLESSMGYAINGYNYREDLLRMGGNAVVPQQSEKAFRTLLMKFL